MRKTPAEASQFFQRLQQNLRYHQSLLRDEVRNKLFAAALERTVKPGSRVLDIGSGSGIWAIYAAKLGASRVTAVETEPMLLPLIRAHARENGVADKIKIVNGFSTQISLPHKFDVIVSEMIGNQAFDEGIVTILTDARDRFLAKGGVMIPQTASLVAAPAHVPAELETPRGVAVATEYLRKLALNVDYKLGDRPKTRLLAPAADVLTVDLRSSQAEPAYSGLTATWTLSDLSEANAILLWARSTLFEEIELDTWETDHWLPAVLPFEAFSSSSGELAFTVNMSPSQFFWNVTAAGEGPRSYTPIFASAKIEADMQFNPRRSVIRRAKQ